MKFAKFAKVSVVKVFPVKVIKHALVKLSRSEHVTLKKCSSNPVQEGLCLLNLDNTITKRFKEINLKSTNDFIILKSPESVKAPGLLFR